MNAPLENAPIDLSTQIAHPVAQGARSPLFFIIDQAQSGSPDHFRIFSGWQWEFLRGKILRAGANPAEITFALLPEIDTAAIPSNAVIVGLGEKTLNAFTDRKSIDKWHLSPLVAKGGQKFIPTFDMIRAQKQFELGLYQELAFTRAVEESSSPQYERTPERFLLNPPLEETFAILDKIKDEKEISCDVETGYGQINTVGFAWSPSDAIAINILPDRCGSVAYHELMRKIAAVLKGHSRKIFQNFIYDVSYFSAYGMETENIAFDTMWAMKVLFPELAANLGNVGRLYTKRIYWKDDGKTTDEESGRRDWGNIRDWPKHYLYNARDTTGTLEAAANQREDLVRRDLIDLYDKYLLRLVDPIREMCAGGMPVSIEVRDRLKSETEARVRALTAEFQRETGSEINPRSSQQVLKYLREKEVKLPKKYNKISGTYQESADAASIKKIRLKHPEMRELALLQEIKSYDTALSRYIDFPLRQDGRLSYSLNGAGTETLRFSGGKDPWDRGFNIQTIPREGGDVSIKSMFVAPLGYSFIDIDLRQAESRFVAYDSADKTLIDMLESGADVHTHVGKAILRQMGKNADEIPKEEFKSTWRQLGKKAGHGLNYFMKAGVFVETVFNELDLVISKKDAELITAAYYGLFPGIPRWHAWIRNELYTKRKLSAPSGWERYFYGRPGDDMNKEAYAWRPQHTIPWITNHLMLHLTDERRAGKFSFQLIYQGHDALFLLAPDAEIGKIAKVCERTDPWHPEIHLPGGRLIIPTEIKYGKIMSDLKEYQHE